MAKTKNKKTNKKKEQSAVIMEVLCPIKKGCDEFMTDRQVGTFSG